MANVIGRTAAWAGLLMVLHPGDDRLPAAHLPRGRDQLGPLGTALTYDLSWWAEGLKLYNAMVVCLCVSYTFVQGGHVRVDLVYSAVKHRTKRMIDMFGCLFFMMPAS
jgi:TRAP-type mannitol/chloroaromatic compound transport system permease small subunit